MNHNIKGKIHRTYPSHGVARIAVGVVLILFSLILTKPNASEWDNACPTTMLLVGLLSLLWGFIANRAQHL